MLNFSLVHVFTAYEVLSDDKKRKQYDQFGEDGLNNNGFHSSGGGFHNFNFDDDLFQDFEFNEPFGHKSHRGGDGFKFSFGGNGFNDFFDDDDDDDDDDDFFGGFSFGKGFGGGFGDFFEERHQERNGDGFHATRHAEFRRSSSSGSCCFISYSLFLVNIIIYL